MREYHEIADRTMDTLTDTLEVIQEDLADDEFDIEYSVSWNVLIKWKPERPGHCSSTEIGLLLYLLFTVWRTYCQITGG
jgi:hypothetical protein